MEAHLEYEALAAQLAQSADALRLTQAALDEMRTNFETSAFAAEKARTDLAAAEERVAALEAALDEDHIGRTFHALDGHKRPYGYMQKSEPPDGGTERSDHCRWDARVFLRELLVHPDSTGARE
jgi:exonuclease VII small subunit